MKSVASKIRDKAERFFRGEFWLHLVTMAFIQVIAIYIATSPIFIMTAFIKVLLVLFPILTGTVKELLDKSEGKYFSVSDLIGTIIGGEIINLLLLT